MVVIGIDPHKRTHAAVVVDGGRGADAPRAPRLPGGTRTPLWALAGRLIGVFSRRIPSSG